jgi:hypothetical protein
MKKLIVILTLFFTFASAQAQDSNGFIGALKAANADQVANYFDKILDIKFPDKDEIKNIGKNQAGIVLKSFFDNNNIKGFDLTSQRDLNGMLFIAGRLNNGGEGYKLTIIMKNKEGRPQVISVRIST